MPVDSSEERVVPGVAVSDPLLDELVERASVPCVPFVIGLLNSVVPDEESVFASTA